jgi:hypothetical protein
MATYRVVAVPTTPLADMEAAINAQAADGYDYVDNFMGADASHHVVGGLQPQEVEEIVNGVRMKRVINRVAMLFRKP